MKRLAIIGAVIGATLILFVFAFRHIIFSQADGDEPGWWLSAIDEPLEAYREQVGEYPSTEEGLLALLNAPVEKIEKWKGPYVPPNTDFLDPWGNQFVYRFPGNNNKESYDLYSLGPDGIESSDDFRN